ncbi:MAG: hypothetical protein ACLGSH_18965 [Acidobacteriota bacterium]
MDQETAIEFQERWTETAKADAQRARRAANRDRVICLIFLIATFGALFTHQIAPGIPWAKQAYYLLSIPYFIYLLKAVTSLSKMRDAEKFLKDCRRDMAKRDHPIT